MECTDGFIPMRFSGGRREKVMMAVQKSMKLSDLSAGERAKVVAVHGSNAVTKRLMEMGVVPGVYLRMVKSAPFGDPLEVRLRGYSLAMRRNEADAIEVSSE